MTVLLKDAMKPNLVQTLENNPAMIHGGPFANIAHGCNSVIATKASLKLADYVVTEAGFGADLGAEKFLDIKCRKAGLKPSAVVLVATIRVKYHGGCSFDELNKESTDYLSKGLSNLERHVNNLKNLYGLPVMVGINGFTFDTDKEKDLLKTKSTELNVPIVSSTHWANGGKGAEELAKQVVETIDSSENNFKFLYEDEVKLWDKMETIAKKIYGHHQYLLQQTLESKLKISKKMVTVISRYVLQKLNAHSQQTLHSEVRQPITRYLLGKLDCPQVRSLS